MKPINFTIIKLTIALIVGIVIAYLNPISANLALIVVFISIVITLLIKVALRNSFRSYWFGIVTYFAFICLGILTVTLHNQKEFKTHYSHYLSKHCATPLITFRIREVLKPNAFYDRYVIDILSINSKNTSGRSILNLKKEKLNPSPEVDAILATKAPFEGIKFPLNPNQFNYKNYLSKRYIYDQITTSNRLLFPISEKKHTLFGFAAQFRNRIKKLLKDYNFSPDELSIINALILGQRQNINPTTYNNYVNAGAIHILAVSGLHVGVLLVLLSVLFKPLERFRNGKLIKGGLILILLWGFAIIAGLSPSVTRAVTMFSLVAIGTHLKRTVSTHNTLTLSIFILLLFKPFFIFDVGFQLSYAAVFSIISIHPLLEKIWQPKFYILKKIWQILTVSTAAQLGVLPLSLFYFHQFPGLFLLSNLIILPFLGVILGLGLLVIILALWNALPEYIAHFYSSIINFLNTFIEWVASKNDFIFQNISFNALQLITSYFLIISLASSIRKISYNRLAFLLISIILFQGVTISNRFNIDPNESVIFHKNRKTVITKRTNTFLEVYSDSIGLKQNKRLQNYKIEQRIDSTIHSKIAPVYKIKNKYLLILDRSGVYNVSRFCPDYILLTNTPKVNLERIIETIQPVLIIADGSNYKSQIAKWKTTCKDKKIPFHYTGEKGAFIF